MKSFLQEATVTAEATRSPPIANLLKSLAERTPASPKKKQGAQYG